MYKTIVIVPARLIAMVNQLRARLHAPEFSRRHRVRPEDFTRQRVLTFVRVGLLILQKSTKAVHVHVREFLSQFAENGVEPSVTGGGWTQARAKLRHTAFVELNQQVLLPSAYAPAQAAGLRLWRGHRLVGFDGSDLRLPLSPSVEQEYGRVQVTNQTGVTGTTYPEACLSVAYDLLNRLGLEVQLAPGTVGEIDLAIQQFGVLCSRDVAVFDRGYTGYALLAQVRRSGAHFISRCSTGSFAAAQKMFRLNRAGRSRRVTLSAPPELRVELTQRGLPLTLEVRFVSVRLSTGELEVLVTSLLDEVAYPTAEFLEVYHYRWGHETYYLMLKSRLDLENWSGLTVEAVRQDLHATVLLANLESVLTGPAQEHLSRGQVRRQHPLHVNHAGAYHVLKHRVLDLLWSDQPTAEVLRRLSHLFLSAPVSVRPDRKSVRRKISLCRSYHFQRHVKKNVY